MSSDAQDIALAGHKTATPLVDNDSSTSLQLAAQATVSFRFRAPTGVSYYTLTSGGEPLDGLAWTLQGRNGSGPWTTLDQRGAEQFRWAQQLRPFRIGKPNDYREYRLRFSGDKAIGLSEVELLRPSNLPTQR
jgi:hypothetical protein